MIDYDKAYKQAQTMANKAQDGSVCVDGVDYILTFDRNHWHYVITQNGDHIINLNVKTLASAKRELKTWLKS